MELRQREEPNTFSVKVPAADTMAAVKASSMEEIVKNLSSRDKSVRAGAEMLLQTLGPTHGDELLRVLELEGQKYRKQKRNGTYVAYVLGALAILYVIVGFVVGIRTGNWDMFSTFGSFGGMFGGVGAAAALAPKHKSLLKVLAELDDVRSVGWLTDTLESQDKEVNLTCERTLTKLLPRMTFADGAILDEERRKILDRCMIKTDNYGFAVAILSAYNEFGDSHSLHAVETVAAGTAVLKLTEIKHQAAVAAESIRSRMATEIASQTLLRATGSPSEPKEMLLRPIEGSVQQSTATLLCPAEEPDSNAARHPLYLSNTNNPQ